MFAMHLIQLLNPIENTVIEAEVFPKNPTKTKKKFKQTVEHLIYARFSIHTSNVDKTYTHLTHWHY